MRLLLRRQSLTSIAGGPPLRHEFFQSLLLLRGEEAVWSLELHNDEGASLLVTQLRRKRVQRFAKALAAAGLPLR